MPKKRTQTPICLIELLLAAPPQNVIDAAIEQAAHHVDELARLLLHPVADPVDKRPDKRVGLEVRDEEFILFRDVFSLRNVV